MRLYAACQTLSRLGAWERRQGLYYMPMIPEAAYAMLACARIGAVHSVVFGGFSPESIKDRILDSDCQTVITADEGVRGGRIIPLKANVDTAWMNAPTSTRCLWSGEPARKSPGLKVVTWITGKPFLLRVPNAHQKSWMLKILCLFFTRQDPQVSQKA